MSMLSAQCDELRQMAESVGLAMPQAATLMMEAADTILSLRDRAQDLQAERDKLRDENQSIGMAAYELGRNSMADENAKLRELVVALYHIHFGNEEESWDAWEDFCPCGICEERHGGEAPCAYTAKDLADECCEPITKEIVIDRMRELGVEVDG